MNAGLVYLGAMMIAALGNQLASMLSPIVSVTSLYVLLLLEMMLFRYNWPRLQAFKQAQEAQGAQGDAR